jgi:hypothetical protein
VIDAARVLAHGGIVQLGSGGDPDLAAAAADWALRKYLGAFRRGDQLSLPEAHVSAVEAAARTAYVAHAAAGRHDVSAVPQQLIAVTSGGTPVELESAVARVRRSQPTLATALASAGRPDLAETLTAPATDLRAMRFQFDSFGPAWAVAVMKFGQGMTELGQTAAAVDAADWLGGILQQLAPWTMTSDEARTTAAGIETWRQSVYGTSGNQGAG